ncbi:S49 family peptidase [Paraburkholderia phymatum]|uniref:Peptidase S49 n=1 Tax=Paraburkholderia phymatum (strain DSM 17167 / CIP 108236 / LMG 21445 / STM815) TaxID=391038 RepID=B2JD08_PARP8|nr:S49 family peptidase [Paraburkholderia phymatum]ACC71064.1 peptidase S49 [Paraburkholderia phymatum STM815]
MKTYPFAAARVFDVPLAIHPTKGQVIAKVLAGRFGISDVEFAGEAPVFVKPMAYDEWDDGPSEQYEETPYDLTQGVAVIDVSGTLVQKSSNLRPYSGMLGYNAIRHNFLAALDDKKVKAIVLSIDSPGGEVAGCFDLADLIYESRSVKPTLAILNESGYSAAYALASACEQITVPRTGGTGSVGVICMHVDQSKAIDKAGLTVTIIKYGDRKADGNQFNPLSKEALDRYQAEVDEMGELFVQTVARNRNLSADVVRKTQATTFLGAAGVEIGFADAVMAPDEAFRSLLKELG